MGRELVIDIACSPALLWLDCQHAHHRCKQIVRIFLFECSQELVQSLLIDLVAVVHRTAVFQNTRRQDGESNTEDLGPAGVHTIRVLSLVNSVSV